jgi:hypothetical protein
MSSHSARWILPFAGGLLALAGQGAAPAGEPVPELEQTAYIAPASDWPAVGRSDEIIDLAVIDRLVADLASPTYRVRASASRALAQIGLPAVSALRAALQNDSMEQRRRAERLIHLIELEAFSDRVRQFVDTGRLPLDLRFPGWERFHLLIGDDRPAREVYALMVAAEPELMWQLDHSPLELSRLVEERCTDLVLIDQLVNPSSGASAGPSVGTACALLFAASLSEVRTNYYTSSCLNNLVLMHDLGDLLDAQPPRAPSPLREPLRRLVGLWIGSCKVSSPMQRLSLAARFELPEGLDPALEMIHTRIGGRQMQYAIFYVAKMGDVDQIALLEDLLHDETELDSRRFGDTVCSTRVQDVALVAVLHLTGQNPIDYGFVKLRENSQFLYQPDTAGFESEDARREALRTWWRWRAENLHEVFPPPVQAIGGTVL